MHRNHFPCFWTALVAAIFSTPSLASFHTFDTTEVFSNADGTVQFVEMLEVQGFNGQNLFLNRQVGRLDVAGMQLRIHFDASTCTDALNHQIVFGSELPTSFAEIYALSGSRCNIGTMSRPAAGPKVFMGIRG